MKKSYPIGILLVVVVVVVSVFVLTSTFQKNAISIGAIIPQTGSGSYWGTSVMKGIELAQADLDKKYGTARIRVVAEDSQSNLAAAVSVAHKLLSVDKVDALYSEFSGISNAVAPVAKSANKALVYSAFNQKIVADNKDTIKTFISFEVACHKFAESLDGANKKVLIISAIGDTSPYCKRGLLAADIKAENIKVVDNFVGSDFRAVLLQNKAFNPDYIIPIMYEDGSFALLKQKNDLGISADLFCYSQDCATPKILKSLSNEYTEGTMFFEIPLDPVFIGKITEKYPDITKADMQGAANAYQSIMALGNALVACHGGDMSCVVEDISNKQNGAWAGYNHAAFSDRVLTSDIVIGEVINGMATINSK